MRQEPKDGENRYFSDLVSDWEEAARDQTRTTRKQICAYFLLLLHTFVKKLICSWIGERNYFMKLNGGGKTRLVWFCGKLTKTFGGTFKSCRLPKECDGVRSVVVRSGECILSDSIIHYFFEVQQIDCCRRIWCPPIRTGHKRINGYQKQTRVFGQLYYHKINMSKLENSTFSSGFVLGGGGGLVRQLFPQGLTVLSTDLAEHE
jgi:hypothetical protein